MHSDELRTESTSGAPVPVGEPSATGDASAAVPRKRKPLTEKQKKLRAIYMRTYMKNLRAKKAAQT